MPSGCGCGEQKEHIHEADDAEAWSLYTQADTDRCVALNEAEPNSLPNVLRAWGDRLDQALPRLRSDADEQLLLKIAFVHPVNIRALSLIGCGGEQNPATVRAFVNVEHMDFDSAEARTPAQTFRLLEHNPDGSISYATKFTKFQNVSTLWLFVADNYGGAITELQYIGFKGSFTRYKRQAVHTVYEARPTKASEDVKNQSQLPKMGM